MKYELLESNCNGAQVIRRKVINFETYEDAVAFAREVYDIAYFEADSDYPGCADFITKAGTIFSIQPVGFKIAA